MPLQKQPINSDEQYKDLAEEFFYLVDSELAKYEKLMAENNHHDLALALPKLISTVNVIGYLRGQDGMFYDFRPHVGFQQDLYAMEDECEKRLFAMIDFVINSASKDTLKWKLQEYYLKTRGFRE